MRRAGTGFVPKRVVPRSVISSSLVEMTGGEDFYFSGEIKDDQPPEHVRYSNNEAEQHAVHEHQHSGAAEQPATLESSLP